LDCGHLGCLYSLEEYCHHDYAK